MANSQVSLSGNLTADPVLRTTGKGTPVVNFTVAVSEGTRDNPKTGFYDVTVWDQMGKNVADSLSRGQRVLVIGKLDTNTWVTQEGENRSKAVVVAEAVGPDLRFATAGVTGNARPTVAPNQVGYMDDAAWAAERAAREAATPAGATVPGDEPF